MKDFAEWMNKNRSRAYEHARKITKYDSAGRVVLGKDDPWRNETVWDEYGKELDKIENLPARSMVC